MAPESNPAKKNLAAADLAGADLAEADLAGANPEAARSLAGATLGRTHGLSSVQWDACAGKLAVVDGGEGAGETAP